VKLAVVLFNLGGPDELRAVEPFLINLFSDPAILRVPAFLRRPLARLIAYRRTPVARKIYEQMGGRSPILEETRAQAQALQAALAPTGHEAKCFIAMRYWHPLTDAAAAAVKAWGADRIVLLPLYPQYSTATTQSSRDAWRKCLKSLRLKTPHNEICCYPTERGFVAAVTDEVQRALARAKPRISYRVLFSAHGLPKRVIDSGDPYQWQVERTVEAILANLGRDDIDWSICYQSRVGPLEWIGPATDAEVRRAGADGKGVIVVPVAFVSEHSETLVELDIEYRHLAKESGVPDYIRVPTVRTHPEFIAGLAALVVSAVNASHPVTCIPGRLCPPDRVCGQEPRRPLP
jgi:protoporphyrin/coproporphyrin ferrochelatase